MRPIFKSARWSTIVEAMIVLVIVTVGVTGTFQVLQGWVQLASTTESRIQAINLAREGIEAVENIRNTNWTKFTSDYENCFDVKDYDAGCVGNSGVAKLHGADQRILSNQSGMWYLTGTTSTWSGIVYDSSWLSSQWWGNTLPVCNSKRPVTCKSKFFRTVTVTDIGSPGAKKMRVRSTVSWLDASRPSEPYVIELEEILTNWKPNF